MSMKNKPPYNWNAVVRSAIRRAFARSPKVIAVMNAGKRKVPHYNKDGTRAKVDRVEYECQVCNKWFPAKFMGGVDHIIPVISVEEGFQDWNTFITRIDCDIGGLQRICKPCHQQKTNLESLIRRTRKYTEALDILEQEINEKDSEDMDYIIKELKKFKGKKKPEEIRQRAIKLLEKVGK